MEGLINNHAIQRSLDKRKNGFLLIDQTLSQPKVNEFLDSYEMNSSSTRKIYGIGLSHFETFLHGKYQNNLVIWTIPGSAYREYNLEQLLSVTIS